MRTIDMTCMTYAHTILSLSHFSFCIYKDPSWKIFYSIHTSIPRSAGWRTTNVPSLKKACGSPFAFPTCSKNQFTRTKNDCPHQWRRYKKTCCLPGSMVSWVDIMGKKETVKWQLSTNIPTHRKLPLLFWKLSVVFASF